MVPCYKHYAPNGAQKHFSHDAAEGIGDNEMHHDGGVADLRGNN
jgi:hypothetical protein